MNNILYVKFENDSTIYTYFVALGNKLMDVIEDIQIETNKTITNASYNKKEVAPC